MSGRKLLIYLAVLLVVAGGYFLSEYYHNQQAAQEKAAQLIFPVKAADITAVTLKSDKGEIHLEKVAPAPTPEASPAEAPARPAPALGEWRLTKPIAAQADELAVTSVLTALAELRQQRQLADVPEDKLKDYGLAKPFFTVEFQTGEQTHLLRFGNRVPGSQAIYARKNDAPQVILVRLSDKETLDRTLTALRSKAIFSLAPAQISELRLIRPQERLTFHKTEGVWKPGETLQSPLRSDKINGLLRQLTGAKAKEFVAEKAEDLKKYGLAPTPALRLTLLAGKQEETLLLGNKQGELYYAQLSGKAPIFLVDKALVEGLPASYDVLEERRLWTGQESEIQKVVWGPPDTVTTAVREKDGWSIQAPDQPARQEAALKFNLALWRLKELEFVRLLPAANKKKEATPAFIFQLLGPEDKSLFRLEEFQPDKEHVQVVFSQGDKTLGATVSPKAFKEFQESLNLLAGPAKKKPEPTADKKPE